MQTDDVLGGRLAAEHLVDLGHQDLIQVCGPLHMNGFERRFRGFNEVLIDAGIQRQGDRDIIGALSVEFGLHAATKLIEAGNLPTTVFAHNDETATGFMHGLVTAGIRVPEDISVIGFDDMPYSAVFYPRLSSVRLPRREWGRLACKRLISILDDEPDAGEPVIIPPELVARDSTAAPRRSE